jgi:hypothetical protein
MTFSPMTLRRTILNITAFNILTPVRARTLPNSTKHNTLKITTAVGTTTFSIMTLSLITLNIMTAVAPRH